jgi:hypothetical protein
MALSFLFLTTYYCRVSCFSPILIFPQGSSIDRNRASPAPVIKLYESLTPEKREAIVEMGQGSLLDIKCEQLHNPVINWFVQCYQPARRAFVIPCRGVIPLTDESIRIMTGLPQGQLDVKYYADYTLEAQISARLFPGLSSRPRVSELARLVEQYDGADDTFKELWMLFIMSTVIAPTTDTKMSNKCYPMLVVTNLLHFRHFFSISSCVPI